MPSRLRTPFALCLVAVLGLFGAAGSARADELSDLLQQIDQLSMQFVGAHDALFPLQHDMNNLYFILDGEIVAGDQPDFVDDWPGFMVDQLNFNQRVDDMNSARQALEVDWLRVLQLDPTYYQTALGAAMFRALAFGDALDGYDAQLAELNSMDGDAINFGSFWAQGTVEGAIGATQLNRNQAQSYKGFADDFVNYLLGG
jgi:hypothetical protein